MLHTQHFNQTNELPKEILVIFEKKAIQIVSQMFDEGNITEDKIVPIFNEIMRPLYYPALVSYEANELGMRIDKYCIKRLKKRGVKGRYISLIKHL